MTEEECRKKERQKSFQQKYRLTQRFIEDSIKGNATNLEIAKRELRHAQLGSLQAESEDLTRSALSPIFSEGSGEASPITPIQVDAPIITRKFENTSCKAGERVVLEVEYIGNNVDIAWYRNGAALDASSGRAEVVNDIGYSALIIASADHLGSTGNYSITLQNGAGSTTNAADLTVEGSPPEVVERPEGGVYKIGSEIKLAGKVIGKPTPQVHWEFNSEEVIDTRFKMYQDAGYACLELESATAKDSGKYTMVAENELGEARWTVTINVSVDDRPTSSSSQHFIKFDKVEAEKKARKSTKKPLKLNIPGKEKRTSVNAARLSKPVELLTPLPDAGKPLFVIAPEDAEYVIGEAAEIKCRIAGDPKPEIQWYKGKWGKLSAVGRISIDFSVESGISTLNIKKIQKPDKGTYRCVAKNNKGEAEAAFTLNVVEKATPQIWQKCIEAVGKEPVDILQDIRDVIAVAQGDAIFEAEIRINVPNVDVKWFKEDTQLEEGEKYHMSRDGESHSLVIKNVTEEDKGEYRIEAGPAKSTANLEVKGESRKSPKQKQATQSASEIRRLPPKIDIKEEIKTAPPKRSVSKEVPPKAAVVEKPPSPVKEHVRDEILKPEEIKKIESVPTPEPIIEIKKEKPVERGKATKTTHI
ncbi:unnamed protein product [Oikopleura dioica]|uniref:Ig-like domain-containing protein n=1 Tax=Oikopleura dioica TaxID=34765 RepID=E4YE72_OIKDI|nr:unnamed protein product [Oikopleura dioica]